MSQQGYSHYLRCQSRSDLADMRKAAEGKSMTDQTMKVWLLLHDTSKPAAVREESEEEDDECACDNDSHINNY